MRPIISMCFILLAGAVTLLAGTVTSCGPSLSTRYPSYQHVISKYAPADEYHGIKVEASDHQTPSESCDCPRIWYQGRWVYYFEGHWFYRYDGFWYTYPAFYVHYIDGVPRVYRRPTRSIRKGRRLRGSRDPQSTRSDSSQRSLTREERSNGSSHKTTRRSIRKGSR